MTEEKNIGNQKIKDEIIEIHNNWITELEKLNGKELEKKVEQFLQQDDLFYYGYFERAIIQYGRYKENIPYIELNDILNDLIKALQLNRKFIAGYQYIDLTVRREKNTKNIDIGVKEELLELFKQADLKFKNDVSFKLIYASVTESIDQPSLAFNIYKDVTYIDPSYYTKLWHCFLAITGYHRWGKSSMSEWERNKLTEKLLIIFTDIVNQFDNDCQIKSDIYLKCSFLSYIMDKWENTKKYLAESLMLNPKNLNAYNYRAKINLIEKNYCEAIDDLLKIHQLSDQQIYPKRELLSCYYQKGDYSEALNIIENNEWDSWEYKLIGYVFYKVGNLVRAVESWLKAGVESSKYEGYNLALAYFQLNEFDEALEILNKIIEKDAENIQALYLRGITNKKLSHDHKAIIDLRTVDNRIKNGEKIDVDLEKINEYEFDTRISGWNLSMYDSFMKKN